MQVKSSKAYRTVQALSMVKEPAGAKAGALKRVIGNMGMTGNGLRCGHGNEDLIGLYSWSPLTHGGVIHPNFDYAR